METNQIAWILVAIAAALGGFSIGYWIKEYEIKRQGKKEATKDAINTH